VTGVQRGHLDQVARGQGSIQQALLARGRGRELFRHADMANVWIDLSNVADHAL